MVTQLELAGMKVEQVYEQITKHGIPAAEAAILVSSWIYENIGKSKRTFNYKQEFRATHPECVSKFSRTFQHHDWIDGESVVQAGETAGEQGFNWRFHRIEEDLDAIRADLVQAFKCLAEMRQSLRVLLDELQAEINRINSDIHACCNGREVPEDRIMPYPFLGNLINQATFLGPVKLNDQTMSVWQTPQGILMLPAVQTMGPEIVTGPRARKAGKLARYIEENPAVRRSFPDSVSKHEFVERFGTERMPDGMLVRELVEMLPDTKFGNLEDLVNSVAEREAAALRTTEGAAAAVAEAFNLQTDVERVADAPLDRMNSIPAKARAVLIKHHVETVGALAKFGPQDVASLLEKEDVRVSAGEAAEWLGTVRTLMNVR